MKISHCECYIVAVPPPHIGGMYWIFVRLATECGIEGVGEIYAATFHPEVVKKAVEDVFERYVKGADPHHHERLFRLGYSSGFTQRPDLTMMGIISGLEMACWDIVGKAAGQPVYQLLGGKVHERLRSYTYLYPQDAQGNYCYNDLELTLECAERYAEQGFTALKFDPAGPYTAYSGHQLSLATLQRVEDFCRELRALLGTRCDLLLGTHGQMVPSSAIRLAKRLERYDPLWFEEPVPPGQAEALAPLAQHTSIPIATGERLTTKYEFQQLLSAGAASILQMNLGRVGGLLEGKKIAALAEAHYAQIAPHLYNGPVGAAASIQLATATPNFLIQESIGRWQGFHSEVLREPIPWQQGFIMPLEKPGIGVELDMQVVAANSPYRGKALHLSMDSSPYDISQRPFTESE